MENSNNNFASTVDSILSAARSILRAGEPSLAVVNEVAAARAGYLADAAESLAWALLELGVDRLDPSRRDELFFATANRAKQPYRAPIREALLTGGPDSYVKTMLSARYLGKTGYFNEQKVGHLIAKFEKNSTSPANETQNMALVGILSTQLLHHQYIDNFQPTYPKLQRPDKIVRI